MYIHFVFLRIVADKYTQNIAKKIEKKGILYEKKKVGFYRSGLR